ncbi:MAG: hypothetical protein K5765_06270 [Clostridia bacterium]|nr:hypothetical protein [Clostridia bacterium]
MRKFSITLRTPDNIFLERDDVEFFSFSAESSSYGVMAYHAPVVTAIKGGICKLFTDYTKEPMLIAIFDGVFKFENNHALVLAAFIENEENYKEALEIRAKRALDQSRRRKQSYSEFTSTYSSLIKAIEKTTDKKPQEDDQ